VSIRRLCVLVCLFGSVFCYAQNSPQEKIFSAPVSKVQAALKNLPGGTSGPLPVLDGFIVPSVRSLDRYQRPYYQCTVHITPAPSGGSQVRVTAKITAWNTDPAHSGYEVLQSNGRLESDLLDRLQSRLAPSSESSAISTASTPTDSKSGGAASAKPGAPEISAPMPQFPGSSAATIPSASPGTQDAALEQEARSLEELVQNQSHPTNLIAVKQDQTPVLQDPSSDAKVLFLASGEDEFEVLDTNPGWVHVRISGLSRGWLRRTTVETLDGSENVADSKVGSAAQEQQPGKGPSLSSSLTSSTLFSVSGEEEGSFPGDWAPLKGKSVKIISVQQAPGTGRITSPQDKMHFAETLLKSETAEKSAAGLVLIFDSEDGGMVAATRAVLDLWKNGALSEQAFWKQCYRDPPEILGSAN
jgi:hypothetical protein